MLGRVNFGSLEDKYAFFRNFTVSKPFARMSGDLPAATGVIRNVKKTSYTQLYEDYMEEQMANHVFPEKSYFCRDFFNVNEKRKTPY